MWALGNFVRSVVFSLLIPLPETEMRPFRLFHFVPVIPVSILFSLMLFTSSKALSLLSIPTIVCLRNFGPLVSSLMELVLALVFPFSSASELRFSKRAFVFLTVLAVSNVLYFINGPDLFAFESVMFGVVNLFVNASLNVSMQTLYDKLKGEQTATGISCYCNIASIPFLILPWLFSDFMNTSSGERSFVANAPQPRWIVVLLLSGIGSYTIGVANFNLRKLVTATSLSVANVSYKLVSTLFSVLCLGTGLTLAATVGVILSSLGVAGYTWERSRLLQLKAASTFTTASSTLKSV